MGAPHVGIIDHPDWTDLFEIYGVHDLGFGATPNEGVQFIVGPATDSYTVNPPVWPPVDPAWAGTNRRWEVAALGRAPGNRWNLGFDLFLHHLQRATWTYATPTLNAADDRRALALLERILSWRPAHTYGMIPG